MGGTQQLTAAISSIKFDLINTLRHKNQALPDLLEYHSQLQGPAADTSHFSSVNGLLLFRGRLVLGKDSLLKELLLKEFHETPIRGHTRVQQTYLRLVTNFFWEGMKKDVKEHVG